MGMQNVTKIYQKVQEIGPVSLLSEFEPRQNLDQSQMSFDNLIGYILSVSMCMQNFITIFVTVQEIEPFSLFGIWSSAKPRPRINVILQFLGLDLFNLKLSAKLYQNIPNGLRVKFHFFSEFEPRQNPDQSQMSFDNLMGYILSIPMWMQNSITIFHSVQEIGPFSLFQNLEFGKTSTDKQWHFTISWARSCQYQCLRRSLSKYSTQ